MEKNRKIVGFIGLGLMGAAFVRCLKRAGYSVVGYDKIPTKIKNVVKFGVFPAKSPKEVAERSNMIQICVTSTKDVKELMFGSNGVAAAGAEGKIIIDHSTTMVSRTREMAASLRKKTGMRWVDAPVSGGPDKAANGSLTVMAGGSKSEIKKISVLMDTISSTFTHFGPVGCGQVAKMVNQILVLNNFAVIAEALALAEAGGIDAKKIPEALMDGHGGSNLLLDAMPRMIARDFKPKGYARQVLKDLDMVHDLARELGVANSMSSQAASLFRIINAKGYGNLDSTAIFKLYDRGEKI